MTDHALLVQSIISLVESRLPVMQPARDIPAATGLSLAHTREIFKNRTGISLGRYLVYRRVSRAAFAMAHSRRSLLEIALDCGFTNPDTFTRAFQRLTGVAPAEFRKAAIPVGRIKLCGGIYGPGILSPEARKVLHYQGEQIMNKEQRTDSNSCLLYGVKRVWYHEEECTPFPASLRSCLNYLGQDMDYCHLMAATGAAFRLLWREGLWDGGNVDCMAIFQDRQEVVRRAMAAAGRDFQVLERKPEITKEQFMDFIKAEIDAGRPVLAFGIIGPPEACIIAGYREGGQTLLGWNFFQENPEFAIDCSLDESGYFVCSNWWENPATIMVLAISEHAGTPSPERMILEQALQIMASKQAGERLAGQAAFDAMAHDFARDTAFPADAPLPLLFERLMCWNDAIAMIGEGRAYAAAFVGHLAETWPGEACQRHLQIARDCFCSQSNVARQMALLAGGWAGGIEQARTLARPEVRRQATTLILQARDAEIQAREAIAAALDAGMGRG